MLSTENVKSIDDSPNAITDALLTASRLLVAVSANSIAAVDEDITIPQFRTLVILSNRDPVNLATLAALLGVKPSAAGRMVDRLVGAGFIDRLPHPAEPHARLSRPWPRSPARWPARRRSPS